MNICWGVRLTKPLQLHSLQSRRNTSNCIPRYALQKPQTAPSLQAHRKPPIGPSSVGILEAKHIHSLPRSRFRRLWTFLTLDPISIEVNLKLGIFTWIRDTIMYMFLFSWKFSFLSQKHVTDIHNRLGGVKCRSGNCLSQATLYNGRCQFFRRQFKQQYALCSYNEWGFCLNYSYTTHIMYLKEPDSRLAKSADAGIGDGVCAIISLVQHVVNAISSMSG